MSNTIKGTRSALEYNILKNPRVKIKYDTKMFFEQFIKIKDKLSKEGVVVKIVDWTISFEKPYDNLYKIITDSIEDNSPVLFITDNSITRTQLFGEELTFCLLVNNKEELDKIKTCVLEHFENVIPTATKYNAIKRLKLNKHFTDTKIGNYQSAMFGFKLLKIKKKATK